MKNAELKKLFDQADFDEQVLDNINADQVEDDHMKEEIETAQQLLEEFRMHVADIKSYLGDNS